MKPSYFAPQVASSYFRLPGGRLRPGEDEIEGLKRKLNNCMQPAAGNLQVGARRAHAMRPTTGCACAWPWWKS